LETDKADVAGKQATNDAAQADSDGAAAKTKAFTDDLKVLADLKVKAAAINDRAQLRVTFYKQFTDEATKARGLTETLIEET